MNKQPMKWCSRGDKCIHPRGPLLPATDQFFHRQNRGFASACKKCTNASHRRLRAANRKRYNAYNREYYRTKGRARKLEQLAQRRAEEKRAAFQRILGGQASHE